MILEIALSIYNSALSSMLSVWKRVELANGVSVFNWVLVCFVASGIIAMIVRSFGGAGMFSAVSGAVRDDRNKKKLEKQNAERKSSKDNLKKSGG